MIQLVLTSEEGQDLKAEVQKRLTELDHEIAHTDSMNFRDMLKRRREAMQQFLAKLPDPPVVATEP